MARPQRCPALLCLRLLFPAWLPSSLIFFSLGFHHSPPHYASTYKNKIVGDPERYATRTRPRETGLAHNDPHPSIALMKNASTAARASGGRHRQAPWSSAEPGNKYFVINLMHNLCGQNVSPRSPKQTSASTEPQLRAPAPPQRNTIPIMV